MQGTNKGKRVQVGIVGATGHTGVELARLLNGHPAVELQFVTSRGEAGNLLAELDPIAPALRLVSLDEADTAGADLVFLCLPHGASAPLVDSIHGQGTRVVDLSGDLRLRDEALHGEIYGSPRSEALMSETVYGLPEMFRSRIAQATVVSNPGCYATAVTLGLLPLAEVDKLEGLVYVDAKSGVSGAGRGATATTHFCSANEDVRPYKIGRVHRHVPEMEQTLRDAGSSRPASIAFVPHLVPLDRGISATCLVRGSDLTLDQARNLYRERFAQEPFVQIVPGEESARIRGVAHTNRCAISLAQVEGWDALVITSAIDNLGKGAAGQAVQNMNLMMEFPETTGLEGF